MVIMSLTDLPVELVHRIFDYCDITTILSVRIICKQLYLMTNVYDRYELDYDYSTADELSLIIRLIRPEKFVSLILSNDDMEDDWFTELILLLDIRQLSRLRSLTLSDLNDVELEYILRTVNSDSLLSLSIHFDEKKYSEVFDIVSSTIARLNVRRLDINTIGYNEKHITWPTECCLKYVIIDTCTYNHFKIMIHSLRYLENVSIKDCIIHNKNNRNVLLSASTSYSSLKSLTITESTLPTKYIQSLLSETPDLLNLKMISHKRQFDSLFDGAHWEKFIRAKLPLLIRFEFFFESCLSKRQLEYDGRYCYDKQHGDDTHISLNSIILPFRTPFWLDEKHWLVACDFLLGDGDLRIYTIPAIVVQKWNPYRCELFPSDSVPRLTSRSINEIIDTSTNKVFRKTLSQKKFQKLFFSEIRM
ncbi:unnamed protein product [Rotaria sp. Silwood2]|nr:unnamed protein product [Rotaria sp. Silwood2]